MLIAAETNKNASDRVEKLFPVILPVGLLSVIAHKGNFVWCKILKSETESVSGMIVPPLIRLITTTSCFVVSRQNMAVLFCHKFRSQLWPSAPIS